jgi:hypothetical protein
LSLIVLPFQYLISLLQTTYANYHTRGEELQVGERGLAPIVLPFHRSLLFLQTCMEELQVRGRGLAVVVLPLFLSSLHLLQTTYVNSAHTRRTHGRAASRRTWVGSGCASFRCPFHLSSSSLLLQTTYVNSANTHTHAINGRVVRTLTWLGYGCASSRCPLVPFPLCFFSKQLV